ncbi:MAG: hypothetical protein WDZ54_05580 [Sneathiella sp.]
MEDEEYSTAVFYTRLFAIICLGALLGSTLLQPVVIIFYLWVMELKEGPATFIVGVIGFGGLIGATFYNGMISRRIQEEEKLHQARNNAAILDAEILCKIAALSRVIERIEKSDSEDVSRQLEFAIKAYPEAFNNFTCESDKEYFAGFNVGVVRQIFLTATAATSMQTIVEYLITEDFEEVNTNKEAFVRQGKLVIERSVEILRKLNQDFNLDVEPARKAPLQ